MDTTQERSSRNKRSCRMESFTQQKRVRVSLLGRPTLGALRRETAARRMDRMVNRERYSLTAFGRLQTHHHDALASLHSPLAAAAAVAPVRSLSPLIFPATAGGAAASLNPAKMTEKLEFRKYDPRVNKHVLFTEAKMK
ncbi:hypothetical protein GW17_00029226 [Ensete ventricosum]|nr:hypothetical protein GW17_00029226 [Ensete ventricosum]